MSINLPNATTLFLDANIFVYHFSGPTQYTDACTQLLQEIESGRVSGCTSTLILAETLHRLMIIEAVGLFQLEASSAVRYLKTNPNQAAKLTTHLAVPDMVRRIGMTILPVEFEDIRQSALFKTEYGLLTNDATTLALMHRHGLTAIATNDADFENVPHLTVWKPS